MNRRKFLLQSAALITGSFFGIGPFPRRTFAFTAENSTPPPQPSIALIIDDIGYSVPRARQFLDLGIPITFAVLPRMSRTHDLACEIHAEGHEIMLHQPMEPFDSGLNPGPGALYVGDRAERITRIMEENITHIPFATGVNNHMGSRFTSSQREVLEALKVVKERGLFFVDSLTSSHSKAYRTARTLEMPAAHRNIFLDNHPEESSILTQLHHLKAHAVKYGHAVGIGHPYPETARAIALFLKSFKESSLSPVYISSLLFPPQFS